MVVTNQTGTTMSTNGWDIAELRLEQNEILIKDIKKLQEDCQFWRDLANRLGTHLGEGLYSEGEWECREYAVAAFATWERTHGAQLFKYEVEPRGVWWFRSGDTGR
jgi:hypothetical protein